MSSAVISTSAARGRPFIFEADPEPHVGTAALGCPVERSSTGWPRDLFQSTITNHKSKIPSSSITPASRLEIRPAPEMVSSGISAIDALTGGLPRGCLTEICGPASSGRSSVLLAALAAATRRGEYCAVIDASDALDPHSLAAAGVDLERLLWVRCNEESPQRHPSTSFRAGSGTEKRGNEKSRSPQSAFNFDGLRENESRRFERRLEQVLRATDLLLESGGFGLIILDLADLPPQAARRIPLTTWFRFRRAVEHKPTILLAIEQQPIAGSCSSLLLQLRVPSSQFPVLISKEIFVNQAADAERDATQDVQPAHAQLLTGLEINVELIRSRLDRKPARSTAFETRTAWAG